LDIDKAFLQGFTYKELAEATGESERIVCFKLPPGSAQALRKFPGFATYDETLHCLQCIKPGTGTKDAPRAFSMKLRQLTKGAGLRPTIYDQEFELKSGLLTEKHVDDINMTGTEEEVERYTHQIEKIFGKCKLNKHQFTNCGVQYTKMENGDVVLDQDAYIKTLRPIVHPELTGKDPDALATKTIADMYVSLRGALAYTTLTQCCFQVFIVAQQRVQEPTNLDVRRLNAITRKVQQSPKKLVYVAMKPNGKIDLHSDSAYKRIEKADDEQQGYGMRGLCVCRCGEPLNPVKKVHFAEDAQVYRHQLGYGGRPERHGNVTSDHGNVTSDRGNATTESEETRHDSEAAATKATNNAALANPQTTAIHLIDSVCNSHRLTIRSSYGAELLAASHGYDDAYPTIVTLIELMRGSPLSAEELKNYREKGGWPIQVYLTLDAESVFKSVTSRPQDPN